MTLLVSQVEALKGNLDFPFPHELNTTLHYGELAKQVLEDNSISYESNIFVQNHAAVEELQMVFENTEQVLAYLNFEKRYVVAEVLHDEATRKKKNSKLFKKTRTTPDEVLISRLNKSFATVNRMLVKNVPVPTETTASEETVNL